VLQRVPEDFVVLSGDDALTLPMMAVGARGVISVASNEVPSEMARMVAAALGEDFVTARRLHRQLMPLMQVNFVEANPVPVKFAMAAMGLIDERYRLPMCAPRQDSRDKILHVLKDMALLSDAYANR
jgi:4-hydroxy-tetrahydrodipicolinate synthase